MPEYSKDSRSMYALRRVQNLRPANYIILRTFVLRALAIVTLASVFLATACVDAPDVRPRAPLSDEQVERAIERLHGVWEGQVSVGERSKPWRWTFDGRSVAVSVDGTSLLPRGWQPTLVEDQTIVLVVAHEAHLKESVLRFDDADRFFIDALPHVVFTRIENPSLSEETSSP